MAVFREIPPEVRLLIYSETFRQAQSGKTPALLKALRGDAKMYNEALEVYYREGTFQISESSRCCWYTISRHYLAKIKCLIVKYPLTDDIDVPLPVIPTTTCIQSLIIDFTDWSQQPQSHDTRNTFQNATRWSIDLTTESKQLIVLIMPSILKQVFTNCQDMKLYYKMGDCVRQNLKIGYDDVLSSRIRDGKLVYTWTAELGDGLA